MQGLRRAYGIAEPVRRGMELKIVRDSTFRPAVLGGMKGGNVHEDILVLGGRDAEIGWEDIFQGMYTPVFGRFAEFMRIHTNRFASRRRVPGTAYLPRRDGEASEDGLLNAAPYECCSFFSRLLFCPASLCCLGRHVILVSSPSPMSLMSMIER